MQLPACLGATGEQESLLEFGARTNPWVAKPAFGKVGLPGMRRPPICCLQPAVKACFDHQDILVVFELGRAHLCK